MKIVINDCFGGFTLSDKAHERLIELGVKHYNSYNDIPENDNEPRIITSDSLFGKYTDNFNNDYRTNPLLIQVVEELGEEASGFCGQLIIIEIPDDVKWQIENYDGMESVHEIHRSWP